MGCYFYHKNEELNNEINKEDNIEDIENNNEQKDEIFGLENQDALDPENLIEETNANDFKNNLQNKNIKYADYPQKMLELINKIRMNPSSYSNIILESINNIVVNQDFDETKPKVIYKKKS